MGSFRCAVCGYVFSESEGFPAKGIAPGTKWDALGDKFVCPICAAPKSVFKQQTEEAKPAPASGSESSHVEDLKELSAGEVSAICSSLAKGCEKQRLTAEMEAFNKIADYFKSRTASEKGKTLDDAAKLLDTDMTKTFAAANTTAKADADRGALRSLVWSEKVSTMAKSLLERYAKEGEAMLKNTRVFVCDICGFIYIGDTPPEICPVCKVPSFKMIPVERR